MQQFTPRQSKPQERYQLFNLATMKRYFLIMMCFLLFSCTETRNNDPLIRNNSLLIEKAFNDIEGQYLLDKMGTMKYYHFAKDLKSDYEIILNNYFEGKPFEENRLNNLLKKIAAINESESNKYQLPLFETIKGNSFQMIQLQYLTLYSIKSIKELVFKNDFKTNKFQIETIVKGDKIKLIINQMDSTFRPCIMIGKLKENKKGFIGNFIMARYDGIYPEISKKDIPDSKSIEGLFVLPTIGGEIDTITFKKK